MTSDDELAAVLSHEMSHLLAEHSNEIFNFRRLQALIMIPVLPMFVGAFFARRVLLPAFTLVAANLLLHLYLLRCLEKEADHIGMLLMAEAGFDPAGATAAFNKLAASSSIAGSSFPQWIDMLSSHPSVSSIPFVTPYH